jgi:RimJ/RimL family protein N-acetyltransferase
MCSERPTVQDFLAKSFGVCLSRGDEIVGWCLSEYNCADRCEVGIEIVEPYQRRGLGTLLSLALVEMALSRSVTRIGWHCWASNTPSDATALKAGFELVEDYPAHYAWLKELE